jgi:hypothetical protein
LTAPLAADTGFSLADRFAAVAAVGALSHQHERAFYASLI